MWYFLAILPSFLVNNVHTKNWLTSKESAQAQCNRLTDSRDITFGGGMGARQVRIMTVSTIILVTNFLYLL